MYQDEVEKMAEKELNKTIGFNSGKWTKRDVLCYSTAFKHGLRAAMIILGTKERLYNAKGKQVN